MYHREAKENSVNCLTRGFSQKDNIILPFTSMEFGILHCVMDDNNLYHIDALSPVEEGDIFPVIILQFLCK